MVYCGFVKMRRAEQRHLYSAKVYASQRLCLWCRKVGYTPNFDRSVTLDKTYESPVFDATSLFNIPHKSRQTALLGESPGPPMSVDDNQAKRTSTHSTQYPGIMPTRIIARPFKYRNAHPHSYSSLLYIGNTSRRSGPGNQSVQRHNWLMIHVKVKLPPCLIKPRVDRVVYRRSH